MPIQSSIIATQRKKSQTLNKPSRLLLSSSSLVSLLPSTLLTLAGIFGLSPRLAQLSVCTTLDSSWHVALLDLGDLRVVWNDWQSELESSDGVDILDILLGGISVLVLTELAGEEDQSGAVSLETCDVDGEGFTGEVLAARINGDTDRWRQLSWDTSGLVSIVSFQPLEMYLKISPSILQL